MNIESQPRLGTRGVISIIGRGPCSGRAVFLDSSVRAFINNSLDTNQLHVLSMQQNLSGVPSQKIPTVSGVKRDPSIRSEI